MFNVTLPSAAPAGSSSSEATEATAATLLVERGIARLMTTSMDRFGQMGTEAHRVDRVQKWKSLYHDAVADRMQSQLEAVLNRLDHLITRSDCHDNDDVAEQARSRADVILELIDHGCAYAHQPSAAGKWSVLQADLTRMLDNMELSLGRTHACDADVDTIRHRCLEFANLGRLPDVLDPDRLARLKQLDSLSPAQIQTALSKGEHPFIVMKPRFSCWPHPSEGRTLNLRGLHLRPLPAAEQIRVEDIMKSRTNSFSRLLSCSLRRDASTEIRDVDAVLQELLRLPDVALDRLGGSMVEILPVRAGSPTAMRLFGHQAPRDQAIYSPRHRLLVVGTVEQGERCVVPSAHPMGEDAGAIAGEGDSGAAGRRGHPLPFWFTLGQVFGPVRGQDGASESASLSDVPTLVGPGDLATFAKACYFEQTALTGFLKALVEDAATDNLQIPLGGSEAEAHAIACGLYLQRQRLSPALQEFMDTKFVRTPSYRSVSQSIIQSPGRSVNGPMSEPMSEPTSPTGQSSGRHHAGQRFTAV